MPLDPSDVEFVENLTEETTPANADLLFLTKAGGGAASRRRVTVANLTAAEAAARAVADAAHAALTTNVHGIVDTSALATQAYAQQLFAANDALLYKGAIDCSTNPNYPAADAGHAYKVSVAGKIGGGSGVNVEVGDLLVCTVDGSLAGTQAAVGANWTIIQVNLDGAVIGPSSATAERVASFDGASGRLVKQSSAPTAPTAAQGTNTEQIASTEYVQIEAGLLVPKSLFDANSILVANSDNTPLALPVAASRILGRKATDGIAALTPAELLALLTADEHTAPDFKSTGVASLGNATSGRFIGAWTTSGAPTGLTAQVNDYGFDVDGKLWVCTIAGTPGTWVNHDDQLITQAEVTTAITNISAVGAGARVDIDAGLVVSVTGARTITLRGCIPVAANNTATNGFGLALVEGTIGGGIGTLLQQVQMTSATANAVVSLTVERTLTQTSGTHTYKLMGYVVTGGVVGITSGAGTRNSIKALKA